MTIINISRQPYSQGDEIAEELARKLNYKLIDKNVINEKIEGFYSNFSAELSDIANEKEPGFIEHFFRADDVYNCILKAIIFEEAGNDNVIIRGRGGHYILPTSPYVLNVSIIAPEFARSDTLMKKQNITKDASEKLIQKYDHDRTHFINYVFHKDVSSCESYDIVFNTYKFNKEFIVKTISDCAARLAQEHPMNENDKDTLKRNSLEMKVEATLRKEISDHVHLEVKCEKLGAITISGSVKDEFDRINLYNLAKSCPGVNTVTNELDTIRLHKP